VSLTSAQLATLKADIAADATLNAKPNNDDGNQFIADAYNALASPAINVWRADVRSSEVVAAVVMTDFIALTGLKPDGFHLIITPDTVDASSANVRQDFQTIFGASTTLTNLTAIAQRPASRLEKLFGTGSPLTSTLYAYLLTRVDVFDARSS
jgi:hypothetical protein